MSLQPHEQKANKSKSFLALAIERALQPQKKETRDAEIKENAHYEFDLSHDFGNHIPNLVVKRNIRGIEDQERKIIPGHFNSILI